MRRLVFGSLLAVATVAQAQGHAAENGLDACDCGYLDPVDNGRFWSDMWHLDFSQWQNAGDIQDIFIANYNIQAKWENTLDRTFTRDNVQINNGVLSVSVTNGADKPMRCGGFGTQRYTLLRCCMWDLLL